MISKKYLKKNKDDLKKRRKKEDNKKFIESDLLKKIKKINLIGCDTIVNSPSFTC